MSCTPIVRCREAPPRPRLSFSEDRDSPARDATRFEFHRAMRLDDWKSPSRNPSSTALTPYFSKRCSKIPAQFMARAGVTESSPAAGRRAIASADDSNPSGGKSPPAFAGRALATLCVKCLKAAGIAAAFSFAAECESFQSHLDGPSGSDARRNTAMQIAHDRLTHPGPRRASGTRRSVRDRTPSASPSCLARAPVRRHSQSPVPHLKSAVA